MLEDSKKSITPNIKIPVARPQIGNEEVEAVAQVLRSGWLTQGPKVQAFEKDLATYLNAKQVFCVSNCTTGLFLILKALDIKAGDEVIVPSYSFIATTNCVMHTGATPIFADIQLSDFNLDPKSVESAITPRTKAVIVAHQGGIPADIEALQAICRNRNIPVIEDAACAIGSRYKGKRIGTDSDFLAFSFHPRKILTTGEGGAIVYNGNDSKVARYLEIARKQGMSLSDFERHQSEEIQFETYPVVGFNFRMTDMQAAVGIEQLKKVEAMVEERRSLVRLYQANLKDIKKVRVFSDPAHGICNYQTLLLTVPSSAGKAVDLMKYLAKQGVSTRRGIMASHLEACYSQRSECRPVSLANTELAVQENIVLPLFNGMSKEEVEYVSHHIRKWCETI